MSTTIKNRTSVTLQYTAASCLFNCSDEISHRIGGKMVELCNDVFHIGGSIVVHPEPQMDPDGGVSCTIRAGGA